MRTGDIGDTGDTGDAGDTADTADTGNTATLPSPVTGDPAHANRCRGASGASTLTTL